MSDKLVSVLLPAYNAGKYVRKAIDSILRQDFKNFELLILDDCSTDDTGAIIESLNDSRIRFFFNKRNQGYLKSCNILFDAAKGDFITFQDADDYSQPNRLSIQVKAFDENPSLGMVGTWGNIVDQKGKFIRLDQREVAYENILTRLPKENQFNGATIMIKREVLDRIGGYREFFHEYGNEDYDWSFRIAEQFMCINIPIPLYDYRQCNTGISKIVSVKRLISSHVVQHLAKQRNKERKDYLTTCQYELLNELVSSLSKPYRQDPSLLYREYAASYMYTKLYSPAILASWNAVRLRPLQWVNWRTLKYCLKNSLFRTR